MQYLAAVVFSNFEDNGIKPIAHPTDGHILLGNVATTIQPIRPRKDFSGLFEAEASPLAICFFAGRT
jgi:hypothetical protein